MKGSLIGLLSRAMADQAITYKGCLIIKITRGTWRHGSFTGTLKECKKEIDKNFIIWNKTIAP